MAEQSLKSSQSPGLGGMRIGTILLGIVCFGVLAFLLLQITLQVVNPPKPHRLAIEEDVPLPSALPDQFVPHVNLSKLPKDKGPLTPGVSIIADHFDFQTLDPNTKLLFVAHSGPVPDKFHQLNPAFDPDKNSNVDGNVLVFDTQSKKLIAKLAIPQVAGIVAAPDHGHVYAADANDSVVYDIDEKTLKFTQIQIGDNLSPDAIEYDPADQKIFVSDPGGPSTDPNAKDTVNILPSTQGLSVIDIRSNPPKVSTINIGKLPPLPTEDKDLAKFGYDIGHTRYDPVLQRVFVITGQLTDQNVAAPADPPPGVSEIVEIDPVNLKVLRRLQLPKNCGIAHGMSIDAQNNIAYVACMQVNPDNNMVQSLTRVNVKDMTLIQTPLSVLPVKPDIVLYDQHLHVVFVACGGGVAVFDVHNNEFNHVGDYVLGKATHTIAVNDATNEIYLPLADSGGRPTLRIVKYNPDGI